MMSDRERETGGEGERDAALRERLLRAQRLETLGLLTAALAHDTNNLMSTVLGHAMLALEDLGPADPAARRIARIVHAAQAVRALTRMVLGYTRDGRLSPRPIDLSGEVRRFAPLLEAVLEGGPELRLELADGLPPALFDATGLQQVLLNLVTNAAHAIGDEPGAITVATGLAGPEAEAGATGATPSSGWLFLRVTDTGAGMDAATQRYIFEPFFTTREEATGLGLAAVRQIARACGAVEHVTSRPGAGAELTILLRVAAT
jgi:signal transduction histidine kinase